MKSYIDVQTSQCKSEVHLNLKDHYVKSLDKILYPDDINSLYQIINKTANLYLGRMYTDGLIRELTVRINHDISEFVKNKLYRGEVINETYARQFVYIDLITNLEIKS